MNADTLDEIRQVISGNLSDYHAPLLLGVWHLVWGVGVGPGWVLAAQVCCFVAGTYMLMRLAFGPLGAAIAASVVTLVPQTYGELGLVGRDTWYTALLLLSAGTLAQGFASGSPRSPRARAVALAASLGAAWLAVAARENAVTSIAVIIGAAVAFVLWSRWRVPARNLPARAGRLGIVIVGAIATTAVFYASQSALNSVLGVRSVHPEQYIYDFDLAGMSTRENRDLFPKSIVPPNRLANLKRLFSIDDVSTEIIPPGHPLPVALLTGDQVAAVRAADIRAVEADPGTWLGLHWDEFLRQISITRQSNVIMHPGIDRNQLGLHRSFPGLDGVASSYVEAFDATEIPDPQGGMIFDIWIYLLVAAAGTASLRHWRDPRALVLGALSLSSLTYQLGVFLSMGVQYRLEYPTVVTGVVLLAAGGRLLVARARRSSRAARASADWPPATQSVQT